MSRSKLEQRRIDDDNDEEYNIPNNKPKNTNNSRNAAGEDDEDEDIDEYAAHEEYLNQQQQPPSAKRIEDQHQQQNKQSQQQLQQQQQQQQRRGSNRSSASSQQGSRNLKNKQPSSEQIEFPSQKHSDHKGRGSSNNNNNNMNNNHPGSEEEDPEELSDPISDDIEEKLRTFDEFLKGKNEEQVLNIRMHQLALCKILVFTHRRSQFKLVEAHTNLGIAYLNYKCVEQAIDHLIMALKKNGNLFNEIAKSEEYHAEILTQLGKSYLEIDRHEDALEFLTKASDIQRKLAGSNDNNGDNTNNEDSANSNELRTVETLKSIAQCYTKMKDFDKAQSVIGEIYDIQSQHYDLKSEAIAMTVVEHAKVFALRGDFTQAVEYQTQAIQTLIDIELNKPENVAALYEVLAEYYEKLAQVDDQIDSLQKVKLMYSEIFGETDKRVIKVKRQITMIFLKNRQNEEALQEILEIEELQGKVYGESSVQIAKTYRLIGTIKVFLQELTEAQKYFSKALKIFEENGMKSHVKDTKLKIQTAKDLKNKKNYEHD